MISVIIKNNKCIRISKSKNFLSTFTPSLQIIDFFSNTLPSLRIVSEFY